MSVIVVPAADAEAIVRFAEPPEAAPDDVSAYVTRTSDGRPDWRLSDDAIALGPPGVIEAFDAWRAAWERVWILDPSSQLTQLAGLATDLDPVHAGHDALGRYLADDDVVVEPADQPALLDDLHHVAELVRALDQHGYGIIDRTPGAERTGLARAWPAHGEAQVVARDEHTEITFQPDVGLVVTTGDGPDRVTIPGIEEVRLLSEHYEVSGAGRTISIEVERARPLAWLLPGSTAWAVRPVPEILTWARTLAGIEEAVDFAMAQGLPMLIIHRRRREPRP